MQIDRKAIYRSERISMIERQLMIMPVFFKLILMMAVVMVILSASKPLGGILNQYERILSAEASGMERLPQLKRQIEILEKQMVSLSSSSIEARLKAIEKAINTGELSVEEISTLQQLSNDFQTLKSYMFDNPEDLVKLKTLQRDYSELVRSKDNYMTSSEVMREISFLQNMFYTILGLFGILVSLVGGSWWFSVRREKNLIKDKST